MVECVVCGREFKKITNTHLLIAHQLSSDEFTKRYPDADRMLIPWNKGETKETNESLRALSRALKSQRSWNFSKWQKDRKIDYRTLVRNAALAELIGVILGDGNLCKQPRTENLRIICNSKDECYIEHIARLIFRVFRKKPSIVKRKNKNAVNINLYQNKISKRLDIPFLMIRCLKGLFETDGCFQQDSARHAQYIEFKNNCKQLREDAYNILLRLGYHPQFGRNYIRLAKRSEVYRFRNLIDFRNHFAL